VSVRAVLGDLGAEVEGRVVHERTVVRREVYFVCWSGVSGCVGRGVEEEVGWVKGVLSGPLELLSEGETTGGAD